MIVNQPGEMNSNGAIDPTSPISNDELPPGWSRARYITREQAQAEYPTYTDEDDDRTIAQLCDEYLSSLHAASWGRSFYITSDNGRRNAAEFIAKTIEGVMEHAKRRS